MRDQTKLKQNVKNWRQRTKVRLLEYKGGACERCGYNRCPEALEFHHLDESTKDFQISGTTRSWDKMKAEADKCILVCANCHREIHSGM